MKATRSTKETPLTDGDEKSRAYEWCKCFACSYIAQCTPSADFYTRTGEPNGPLFCEQCVVHRGANVRVPYRRVIPS